MGIEERMREQQQELERLRKRERDVAESENEIQEILAEGLGYTYDDEYGWAVGDHVAASLASEARDVLLGRGDRIKELQIVDKVREFLSTMDAIGGCGDNSCLVERPLFAGTNGGCRCVKDSLKMNRVLVAAKDMRDAVEETGNRT